MLKSHNISLIVPLLFALSVFSTNYYVSKTNGNDSNLGTSTDAPWQNCPGMNDWTGSTQLKTGDTVFFNSAEVWEVSEGSAVLQVIGGIVYDGEQWGSGSRAVFRAKTNLKRSVIAILKDHTSIPTVVRGFNVDAGRTVTTGIGINHPQMENPLLGATKRIENCVVHDVLSYAPNTYKYGIVISNWNGQYQVKNVEVLHCKVYNISRGGINLYPGNDTAGNWIENILVRGNEVWATGMDSSYAGSCLAIKNHVINTVVEYNYIHDPIRGIGMGISTHPLPHITGPEKITIRHNIIANSQHAGIYFQGKGKKDIAIYGNIIRNSKYQGINLSKELVDTLSLQIYNNTFYNNYTESQWSAQIGIQCEDAIITTLALQNNLFFSTGAGRALYDSKDMITNHTNNLFYKTQGGDLVIVNGAAYTANNLSNWETTGVVSNPLFVDTTRLPNGFIGKFGIDMRPNTDGLNINDNSPAKDKALALDTPYRSSINSVTRPYGSGWDIGAYEYNGIIANQPQTNQQLYTKRRFYATHSSKGILFTFFNPGNNKAELSIFNGLGRRVISLPFQGINEKEAKMHLLWNGKDPRGVTCAKGLYLVRIRLSDNWGPTGYSFILSH